MDHPASVAGNHRFHDLPEEVPGQLLLEHAFLGDEVEQVLAGRGLLHHVDEGVDTFVKVKKSDDARHDLDLGQELQLERHSSAVELQK